MKPGSRTMAQALSTDVAIVGSGVAGSVAALLLARTGARVLVLDRKPDASRHKALCTHFVQPVARRVLRKLGLETAIEEAGGVPTKAAFWTAAGWIDPPGDYARRPEEGDGRLLAYNVERRVLDPLLAARLSACPGVDLRLAHDVTAADRAEDGGWRLEVSPAHGPKIAVATRLLVAGDGRVSRIAERLGNAPVSRSENQRACTFAYFEGVPAPAGDRSLFLLGDREMAFLYPLGGERALLSAYVPKDRRLAGDEQARADQLVGLFSRYPDVPDLARARLASAVMGYRDYANIVRRPVHAGAAFVGDAALSLDPMSGVGCAFAMLSADMMAEALAPALMSRDPGAIAAGLEDYDARFKSFFPAHAAGIAADSIIAKSEAATSAVYTRICRSPDLQRAFIALTGRVIQPSEFQQAYLAAGLAELRRPA